MKRVLLAIIILLTMRSSAWATWSVIAIDKKTGQVIVASATCLVTMLASTGGRSCEVGRSIVVNAARRAVPCSAG